MSKEQKILTTGLWALVVVAMIATIASWSGLRARHSQAGGDGQPAIPVSAMQSPVFPSYTVPDFSLTDQESRSVTLNDLKGHVWVAAFIFTRCSDTCPMMSKKMQKLQAKIDDASIKLVSFSVDPAHDTPEVLKNYAKLFGADSDRWLLLTGDRKIIENVAWEMKLGVEMNDKPENITHSDRFVLVGPDGKTRGVYVGGNDQAIDRLAADAKDLAAEHAKP